MSRRAAGFAGGRDSPAVYPRGVSRFNAWSLLAVFGIGVFLAGLELMITATALPSILQDLAISDQLGRPAFAELRHACPAGFVECGCGQDQDRGIDQ